ncbi:Serine/threonine-protein kinase PK-1 [Botrimarina colliarenosi]|uniref:Serine/threonine-protein kinase PK-1 n=1 Tax=Botrimarina colliarenosi TaxID=2528001 RepID=A0A5C6AA84_9BACT|nr:serine/threonine-protein kinase [Botrimarina colliarenosi]TWT95941.1 Serine/threonine-protein kinase PK-1 [Botrimarina colliarenosi]
MASLKEVGDRVGPYQIVGVLGVGGAGQVFKAVFDPTDEQRADAAPDHPREVALKLLLPSAAANEAIYRRFVREIGVARQIHHPHILRFVDSGLAGDLLYYAMEVAPYGSLREVIQKRSRLPWRDAAESAAHVADALGALHDRGVVHRDLKPENVFLAEDGALKLGDFGLVRRDDGAELTTSGQTVGSVRYMAPEQVRGRRDIDGRCDLYALGCLLFELLTGRPPFPSTEPMVVFQQHVEAPPPKLRTLAADAPKSLERLMSSLLEKEKEDRPATAQAVRDALRALLASENGEIEDLEDRLDGAAVEIEPLPPDEEDDDSLTGGQGLSGHELAEGIESVVDEFDDDLDDDLYDEPARSQGLSQRLAATSAKPKQGCLGVLMLLAVGATLSVAALIVHWPA